MSYSKRLHHVGLSSEHNEYMALAAATKAVIWLRQLLQEADLPEAVDAPTMLFGDNVQANKLCREHFVSSGNQYISLPYHLSREAYKMGLIDVIWVASKHNLADVMTKALTNQQLNGSEGLLKYLLGYASTEEFKERLQTTLDFAATKQFKRG